ncbi:MAG: exodeoxyribonuclease III [Pseudomonadales bacterium]|nr:exodeoxyribonuclease III [Pseudomonadales bacterium]
MKLVSWNVNGIRAIMKKDFLSSFQSLAPDILCLQETKAQCHQVEEAISQLDGYHCFTNSAEKKGYSGTAILSKNKPSAINVGIGILEHDNEGRVITADFDYFLLVNVYTPNSGSELKRLGYRQQWDQAFLGFLQQLRKQKPVIVCGDFNVAHTDLDLARPKQNYNKAAGYMQEEINGFHALIDAGFIDTFRHLHPDDKKYSWWSYRAGARERNVGWRIDYFISSPEITERITSAEIHNEITGSDHCPVSLTLSL